MNNDVAGKLNNDFDAQKKVAPNNNEKFAAQKTSNPIVQNLEESVNKSVQEFLNESDLIQAHVDFCDTLTEKGYCLREAIEKTDSVFVALHQKDIYN